MNTTIGDVLYRLRTEIGESQEQVADASEISRVSYTRYESNQREPKASAAIRLARHFNVTVEYLYGYTDEKKPTGLADGQNASLERLLNAIPKEDVQRVRDFVAGLKAAHEE